MKNSAILPFYTFRFLSNVRTFFASSFPQGIKEARISYGAGTVFGENVCIEPDVIIGKNCFIGTNTVIRNGTVIGDNCVVGHLVLIEENVKMGHDSTVQSQCHITAYATIEENVFFGPSVTCVNDTDMVKYHPERGAFVCKGPVFQSGCSIGAAGVILPGVNIGKNSIIGAGSVVTKNVPDGETWFGPCAKLKGK